MGFGINKTFFLYLLKPRMVYVKYKKRLLLNKHKGKNFLIGDSVSVNNSIIGNYVYLGDEVQLNKSEIGDHSYVNTNTILNNTKIGKFCSIASYVKFGLGSHPTHFISTHPSFYSNKHVFKTYADRIYFKKEKKIIIGNDVWIGESVTIMIGVNVGDGAIVATGSIVTKDVQPFEIVGGIPARHIKYRFDKKTIKQIQISKWWEKDEVWFEENYKLFLDLKRFLEYFHYK